RQYGRAVARGREVQVVPMAPAAGRRTGMLRPSGRAANRPHQLQPRSVVPRLHALHAPPHAEETIPRRLPILVTPKILSRVRPTRPAARADDRRASADGPPVTGPSSRM